MDIGRRIYEGEIDRYQAAEEYGINDYTARDYMRLYRDTYQLPHIRGTCGVSKVVPRTSKITHQTNLQKYQDMSKEELIQALIQARITEARLKKGYEVKRGWFNNSLQQQEYQVILELSGEFPVNLLSM